MIFSLFEKTVMNINIIYRITNVGKEKKNQNYKVTTLKMYTQKISKQFYSSLINTILK